MDQISEDWRSSMFLGVYIIRASSIAWASKKHAYGLTVAVSVSLKSHYNSEPETGGRIDRLRAMMEKLDLLHRVIGKL